MNRRALKTRSEITRVFLELLAQKPLKTITVKEIADGADITRATFYSHYNDIYDLLEQARREAVNDVVVLLDRSIHEGSILTFTTELFSYFEKKQETFSLILGENGDVSFLVDALNELQRRKDELVKTHREFALATTYERVSKYQFTFVSGGLLHILTEWISKKERMPVDKIAAIAACFVESTCTIDLNEKAFDLP